MNTTNEITKLKSKLNACIDYIIGEYNLKHCTAINNQEREDYNYRSKKAENFLKLINVNI